MDLLSNSTTVKTPDAQTETPTPTRIQPARSPPFSNGVLKRHAPLHLHHHHPVVVTYKECLKNHAAALGGHALDGCGEFMPAPTSNPADPTSLTCAACGCHRNFHRRDPEETLLPTPAPAIEYLSHRRHHPPPPPPPPPIPLANSGDSSPNNSPPPISSSYYPSAPHMLLALSHGGVPVPPPDGLSAAAAMNSNSSSSRKRFRSKFTQFQKEKMLEFAEKLGWKMQKKEEESINDFCNEIGVEKGVLKVWMHNNKSNFAKKDHQIAIANPPESTANGTGITYSAAAQDNTILGTNGSSSS